MPELHEHDAMICRACGEDSRASEGYPCEDCGTYICLPCVLRGAERCTACEAEATSHAQRADGSRRQVRGDREGRS